MGKYFGTDGFRGEAGVRPKAFEPWNDVKIYVRV